jgi:hypothetical protein
MLYVMPVCVGMVTVIVPVETVHVGCWIIAVGTEGVAGCALMVVLVAEDMQPTLFFAVTLYVPAKTLVKMPVGWL